VLRKFNGIFIKNFIFVWYNSNGLRWRCRNKFFFGDKGGLARKWICWDKSGDHWRLPSPAAPYRAGVEAPSLQPQRTSSPAPQATAAAGSDGSGGAPPVEWRWGGESFRGGASWEVMRRRLVWCTSPVAMEEWVERWRPSPAATSAVVAWGLLV
jgi:hypothetical protein